MKKINMLVFVFLSTILFVSCTTSPTPTQQPTGKDPTKVKSPTPEKKPTSTKVSTGSGSSSTEGSQPENDSPIFDLSNTQTTSPSDVNSVIHELVFFGRGGGGDDTNPCANIETPTMKSDWFDVEQMENVWAYSCGWRTGEKVSVSITKSDGSKVTDEISVGRFSASDSYGSLFWIYRPTAFDPTGTYRVSFSNSGQSQTFEFKVSPITQPGIGLIYENKEIQIYNFRPQEKVRLFKYVISEQTLVLERWKEFKIGSDGKLRIQLEETKGFYALVGEKTGEYHLSEGFGQSILKANTPVLSDQPLCPGAPKSNVGVGSTARVTFTDGTSTRIRKQPSTSADIVGRLAEGTRFLIIGGHECNNGYTWWKIELPSGTRGWMAEGKGSTYFLEPMNYLQQTCVKPGSRLSIGDQARVAYVDGSNMRLREEPGFAQVIKGKVAEGTALQILNGPKCIDGANWWYVRTNSGMEGWMTEWQNTTYLLEPID